jgi:hypothetical protein
MTSAFQPRSGCDGAKNWNVRPVGSVDNPGNRSQAYAVCLGDFSDRPAVTADCMNVVHRKFGDSDTLLLPATVSKFVGLIATARIPSQVAQAVVGWVVVKVAALKPRWARTDVGQKYRAMHKKRDVSPVDRWVNRSPKLFVDVWSKDSAPEAATVLVATIKRSNAPLIRGFVAREIGDRLPNLFHIGIVA